MASTTTTTTTTGNIKVVCRYFIDLTPNSFLIERFRPQNAMEDREGGTTVIFIDASATSCRVDSRDYPGQYTFDAVFDWHCKQNDLFNACGGPLVDQCFQGFNSTLFCYGQTGSGKTYTMMGSDIDDDKGKGITPRIVERVFQHILDAPSSLEFTVKVSFMEIYMERIRDLLNPLNDNLPIHEDKSRGIHVKGLKEIYVSSTEEVLKILKVGDISRKTSSTNMNEESSRSHSIVTLTIVEKDIITGSLKEGRLSLVDLAGSEKVGKTGATGQTLEEAKKINKSLTTLGMVINSLTDGKSTHVPYRDSKLTRILQESLGGNSMTTLIINCSPSSYNDAETVSTLRFGIRAKSIKNKATINVELSPTELKTSLKQANAQMLTLQAYITSLEQELAVWRSGGKVVQEEYASMTGGVRLTDGLPSPINTDSVQVSGDERDEFLERENELMDQLSEKEAQVTELQRQVDSINEEIQKQAQIATENKELGIKLSLSHLEVEKLEFEKNDAALLIETLKNANDSLTEQLSNSEAQQHAHAPQKDEEHPQVDRTKKTAEMMQEILNTTESSTVVTEGASLESQHNMDERVKKSLMKDLQNRCEKVVELEILLDDIDEKYQTLLRSTEVKSQQKKMAFLERNLDQLAKVQRVVVEQNQVLKKNADLAEKKIANRDSRISDLERLIQESNVNLGERQAKHELEMKELKQELADARKIQSPISMTFNDAKIVKPLRGGVTKVSNAEDT